MNWDTLDTGTGTVPYKVVATLCEDQLPYRDLIVIG
jgi:hypothetical protein